MGFLCGYLLVSSNMVYSKIPELNGDIAGKIMELNGGEFSSRPWLPVTLLIVARSSHVSRPIRTWLESPWNFSNKKEKSGKE